MLLFGCGNNSKNKDIEIVFYYKEAKLLSEKTGKDIFVILDLWSSSNHNSEEILLSPKFISYADSIIFLVVHTDDVEFNKKYEQLPQNLKSLIDFKRTPMYLLMNSNDDILKGPIEFALADTIFDKILAN